MEPLSITILGGDLRQCYAAEYFHALGWQVFCFHTPDFPFHPEIVRTENLRRAIKESRLVLAPTPLTLDNENLFQTEHTLSPCPLADLWKELTFAHTLAVFRRPKECRKALRSTGCRILEFGGQPSFIQENARLTAEGLLSEIIRCTPFSLMDAAMLLIGYGNCGSAIGTLFSPLCRRIYLLEQETSRQKAAEKNGICQVNSEELPAILPQCRLLVNTVPASVLDPSQLPSLHSSCHIFDIASAPFGFPADTTEKYLLPYYRIPGIPGRFSPVAAGEIIGRTIERMTEYAL